MAKYAVVMREGGGEAARWDRLIPGAELFAIDRLWKLVELVGPLYPLEPGKGYAQHAVVTEVDREVWELSEQEWEELPKFDFHAVEQILDPLPRQRWRAYRARDGALHVYFDVADLRGTRRADVPADVQHLATRIEAVEHGTRRALVLKDMHAEGQILDRTTEPERGEQ